MTLASSVRQQAQNKFVNEDKAAEVTTMLPGESYGAAHLLDPASCAKEGLHDDGVGNADAPTVVEALTGAHEGSHDAAVVWTAIMFSN